MHRESPNRKLFKEGKNRKLLPGFVQPRLTYSQQVGGKPQNIQCINNTNQLNTQAIPESTNKLSELNDKTINRKGEYFAKSVNYEYYFHTGLMIELLKISIWNASMYFL